MKAADLETLLAAGLLEYVGDSHRGTEYRITWAGRCLLGELPEREPATDANRPEGYYPDSVPQGPDDGGGTDADLLTDDAFWRALNEQH